jgi:hypothetical protein
MNGEDKEKNKLKTGAPYFANLFKPTNPKDELV